MHLSIAPGNAAVALKDHGRVVVHPRCSALEQGADEHHLVGRSQCGKAFGGRPWDRFGQVEGIGIFGDTKVRVVVQFRQHHEVHRPGTEFKSEQPFEGLQV